MSKVLDGVRVVEIAGIGPGPFCAMLLADLGAEVISIERLRAGSPRARAAQIVQRGKRSVLLDLKAAGTTEAVLRVVEGADALIEGMRPGVMERIGLGPEVCLARNPRLAYGRMTGWGQHGPLSQAAGHDSNYTALAGALWYASPASVAQQAPPTIVGDIGGGALYLAVGLLAAILHARSTGQGQVVDAAIVDGSAHMLNLLLGVVAAAGGDFSRGAHAIDAAHWAGRSYLCADRNWINIAPLEPQFYAEFLGRIGLEEDEAFVSGHMDPDLWPQLSGRLAALFASRPREAWCSLLEGTDSCFAPVLTPGEASQHPHLVARGVYTRVDNILQTAPAPRFSACPAGSVAAVPGPGADTRAVLAEAGFDDAEIVALTRAIGL